MSEPIKLTKYQREEVYHLWEVAEGMAEHLVQKGDLSCVEDWAFARDAYKAMLDGDPITKAQGATVIEEVVWHRDKYPIEEYGREVIGSHISMNNLIKKIKRAIHE